MPELKLEPMPASTGPGWVAEHGEHTWLLWAPRPANDVHRGRDDWQLHHCRTLDGDPYAHIHGATAAAVLRQVRPAVVRTAFERAAAAWTAGMPDGAE